MLASMSHVVCLISHRFIAVGDIIDYIKEATTFRYDEEMKDPSLSERGLEVADVSDHYPIKMVIEGLISL